VPTGIKRAALVALGTVAAACGGKTDGTDEGTAPIVATEADTTVDEVPSAIAIYGAPISPSNTEAVASETTNVEPTAPPTTLVPVYGAPIPPSTTEPATSTSDSESTTAPEDTWGAAPAYGLPPWDPTCDVVLDTTEPSIDGDAGGSVDGGASADAGVDDVSTQVDEFTDLGQPEYGAPVPEQ
jgi:hypothetical protein